MPTTVSKFVDKCNEVYEAKPKYQNGASDLSECDCIGMDKYSFRQNGVKFSTTGTNWSFRNQVDNIRELKSADQLHVGDVVFKAYTPLESGYNLPEKYQHGGSWYNGDLNDYYHIGTVKSVNPLQIIHMTSPTAKMDTILDGKGWDYAAQWKKDYISDYSIAPTPTPVETATVYAEKANTVKMRAKPSTGCSLYWDVPVGAVVDLMKWGDDWSNIKWDGIKGYMMSKFLIRGEYVPGEPDVEPGPGPVQDDMVMVRRSDLCRIYKLLGDILGLRG